MSEKGNNANRQATYFLTQMYGQWGGQAGRQTSRQTERQTGREGDWKRAEKAAMAATALLDRPLNSFNCQFWIIEQQNDATMSEWVHLTKQSKRGIERDREGCTLPQVRQAEAVTFSRNLCKALLTIVGRKGREGPCQATARTFHFNFSTSVTHSLLHSVIHSFIHAACYLGLLFLSACLSLSLFDCISNILVSIIIISFSGSTLNWMKS